MRTYTNSQKVVTGAFHARSWQLSKVECVVMKGYCSRLVINGTYFRPMKGFILSQAISSTNYTGKTN